MIRQRDLLYGSPWCSMFARRCCSHVLLEHPKKKVAVQFDSTAHTLQTFLAGHTILSLWKTMDTVFQDNRKISGSHMRSEYHLDMTCVCG
mmetsp:Transcript_19340/g.45036  ORF Transcript_19340/g.45036 Transcript_19340/m.45036 type:complete len:90 (-) Transcript_19340:1231-1500(-)